MSTKVFISWSGTKSRKLGEALRGWLPGVIQAVEPYFTPSDVEKGSRWLNEISRELEQSSIGIFCLTRTNLTAPWLHFEAGALSKQLAKSRVCPILFGVDASDIKGPLVQFQSVQNTREDFKKLITLINAAGEERQLEPGVLDEVFDLWWPKLEPKIADVLSESDDSNDEPLRPERDILEEILDLTRLSASRSQDAVERFDHDKKTFNPKALLQLSNACLGIVESLLFLDESPDASTLHSLGMIGKAGQHICNKGVRGSVHMKQILQNFELISNAADEYEQRLEVRSETIQGHSKSLPENS